MISSNVVLNEEDLKDVVKLALRSPAFSYDLEASGENRGVPHLCTVSWVSLATDDLCVSIPLGHPIGSKVIGEWKQPRTDKNGKVKYFSMPTYEDPPPQLSPGAAFGILRPLFFNDRQLKITHGGPGYDFPALHKYFGEVPSLPWDCTMTMGWLCDENRKQFGLKEQVRDIYGVDYDKEHVGRCVEKWPFNKVARYAYLDALYPWFMHPRFLAQIKAEGLEEAYELEQSQYLPVCDMKLAGIHVDIPRLEALRTALTERLVDEEAQVYKSARTTFNINSAPQKQHILFDPKDGGGQGLTPWKETPGGGWSTDASVLESFPNNPVCQSLMKYADTHKLLSNYVLSWLGDAEAGREGQIHDGKIHCTFKPYGTVSVRYSSANPNLQNIPRPDTDDGRLLRGVFIAPEEWALVVGDYGQIELVILAHLIGYGRLYDGFWAGVDPHLIQAASVLDKDPADVTKDERQYLGKAQPLSAPILTPYGWTTMGEIQMGDRVSTPDGKSAEVVGVYPQGVRPVWTVSFSDGTSVRCDPEHLWKVQTRHSEKVLTARELRASGLQTANGKRPRWKYAIPLTKPVGFANRPGVELPLDAYLLGVLLGDGSFRHPDTVSFTTADDFIREEVRRLVPAGVIINHKDRYDYTLSAAGNIGRGHVGPVKQALLDLGLWGLKSNSKFIPSAYLYDTKETRVNLLRGLMDTDGHCSAGSSTNEYSTTSFTLADQIAFLVRSLGGVAKLSQKTTTWTYNGVRKEGTAYRLHIWTPFNPFRLPRKASQHITRPARRKVIVSVQEDYYDEPVQCILLDHPDHLYITSGVTVTHNTLGFTIVNGAGDEKVASMIHGSVAKARKLLAKHERENPEIYAFKAAAIAKARERTPPYIRTLAGHKRRLPDLNSNRWGPRMYAERQLFNTLIQGGAAVVIKRAIPRAYRMIAEQCPEAQAKLILTIHDELVILCLAQYAKKIERILIEAMTGPEIQDRIKVPLTVDTHIVQRWSDAKLCRGSVMGVNDCREKYLYAVELIRTAPVESEAWQAAGEYILAKEWERK